MQKVNKYILIFLVILFIPISASADIDITFGNIEDRILYWKLLWVNHPFDIWDHPMIVAIGVLRPGDSSIDEYKYPGNHWKVEWSLEFMGDIYKEFSIKVPEGVITPVHVTPDSVTFGKYEPK